VHCSRVFRSSAPSDLLPSSPGGRPSGTAQGECGSTRSMEWGVGPGGGVPHRGCCPAGKSPARHIPEGTLPGPVRSPGRVARRVIQDWSHMLSAPRRAWNLHGNHGARCMDSRSRPDTRSKATSATRSKSPGGVPDRHRDRRRRAEYLAGFLDRDECAQRGQPVPPQQAQLPRAQLPRVPLQPVRPSRAHCSQVRFSRSS
jgi:hypothetical protein